MNLWVGPEGGSGTCKFRGGTATVKLTVDTANLASHVYVATTTGIDLGGGSELDALIYAYNKDASGTPYGYVTNSGNPDVYGQIIADKYDMNGNIAVHYITDLISATGWDFYGFDTHWWEMNPR